MQNIIKSRFSGWIFLVGSLSIFLTGAFFFILNNTLTESDGSVLFVYGILFLVILFTWTWAVFGELRTKAIAVVLEKDTILVRRFLGIGPAHTFNRQEFDGYATSQLSSNYGEYEYLYLMKGNRKQVKISEFYHRNYEELKTAISLQIKDLGDKPYSLSEELKEIFQ